MSLGLGCCLVEELKLLGLHVLDCCLIQQWSVKPWNSFLTRRVGGFTCDLLLNPPKMHLAPGLLYRPVFSLGSSFITLILDQVSGCYRLLVCKSNYYT